MSLTFVKIFVKNMLTSVEEIYIYFININGARQCRAKDLQYSYINIIIRQKKYARERSDEDIFIFIFITYGATEEPRFFYEKYINKRVRQKFAAKII